MASQTVHGNSPEGMVKGSRRVPQILHGPVYPTEIAGLVLCAYRSSIKSYYVQCWEKEVGARVGEWLPSFCFVSHTS